MAGKTLWKPSSEKDGNLVILADTNQNISLVDSSGKLIETGRSHGGSNGYGNTVRFNRPGGSYAPGTRIMIGDSQYDVGGDLGRRNTKWSLTKGPGVDFNVSGPHHSGGSFAGGLGAGLVSNVNMGNAAFGVIPGQERALRQRNEDLFARWQDTYGDAIEDLAGNAGQSHLNYLQAQGAADLAQGLAGPAGDLSSGIGSLALARQGILFGQGQGINAGNAITQDEFNRINNQLGALEVGKGIENAYDQGLGQLAQVASSGALSVAGNEAQAQMQKAAHDAKLEIAGIENEVTRKQNKYRNQTGLINLITSMR